jgi:uncharacterized membrane protein YedE/YeeE
MAVREGVAWRQAAARRARLALPGWLTWGTVIGLVQLFAFATVGPLGVSTAYPQLVGALGDALFPGFAQAQPYLREIGASIGWEVMLVFGLFAGALLSAGLSRWTGRATGPAVAPVCVRGFEGSRARRYLRAFLGGFLFIFGARLAGGCTTGHILSGTAQMAVSGLVFGAAVFAAGYLVARLAFREPAACPIERG